MCHAILLISSPDQRGITASVTDFIYQNNGDGTFAKITDGPIVTDGGDSESGSWIDYDRDGNLDLFVANTFGNNFLYRNNGDGTFNAPQRYLSANGRAFFTLVGDFVGKDVGLLDFTGK